VITAVLVTPPSYGTRLSSLLEDAGALEIQADDAGGALRWLIVEDLVDALEANARILRFKSYLVTGAIALLLSSVPLVVAHDL
jgi:hypothetical protein